MLRLVPIDGLTVRRPARLGPRCPRRAECARASSPAACAGHRAGLGGRCRPHRQPGRSGDLLTTRKGSPPRRELPRLWPCARSRSCRSTAASGRSGPGESSRPRRDSDDPDISTWPSSSIAPGSSIASRSRSPTIRGATSTARHCGPPPRRSSRPIARRSCRVRLRLEEKDSGRPSPGQPDVRVLVTLPGRWQRAFRTDAQPDAGTFAFDFTPPRAGLYVLYVDIPSSGPAPQGPPVLHLEVKEPPR